METLWGKNSSRAEGNMLDILSDLAMLIHSTEVEH